ncbi:MAG: DUF4395 domain-containing protein [Candidatus Kapabacteria bacterium]|jgi:hypothetical protein|nr:DUF4395 domain-containing protein [Candidatus Kapabacteria bacterium]
MAETRQLLASEARTFDSLDVPLPIVNFSRAVYVLTLSLALLLQQPLLTTALLLLVVLSLVGGARWNLITRLGRLLLQKRIKSQSPVPLEDARLLRFNSLILVVLLGAAQVAFWVANAAIIGWVLVGAVLVASAAALAGFCLGCVLYYQFKLHKYKFLGEA